MGFFPLFYSCTSGEKPDIGVGREKALPKLNLSSCWEMLEDLQRDNKDISPLQFHRETLPPLLCSTSIKYSKGCVDNQGLKGNNFLFECFSSFFSPEIFNSEVKNRSFLKMEYSLFPFPLRGQHHSGKIQV